jgi:hypothetical protein
LPSDIPKLSRLGAGGGVASGMGGVQSIGQEVSVDFAGDVYIGTLGAALNAIVPSSVRILSVHSSSS